jgi:dephospho-CoA kinase
VGDSSKKPIIGILGGIGSGKSTVASELCKLGCKVIDADKIAHKALDKKTVKRKIVRLFGERVLEPSGQRASAEAALSLSRRRIDRRILSDIVFADAGKLSSLNKIIHPLVLKQTEELIKRYRRQSQAKAIVLDMPLLVEVGWAERCDKLIFVGCKRRLRVSRAKKMGLDENQIKIREKFQISLDNKADIADNQLDNNSDFTALVRQVTDIFSNIVNSG